MSSIKAALGLTKNIGNYESLRIDAEITVDVKPGDEHSEEEWDKAWEEVDRQVEKKLLELEATTDGK